MTTTTLKVKNGAIKLPKNLQKAWKDAEILARLSEDEDTVVLKKMKTDSFWTSWGKMKSQSKGISRQDIQKAISWARTTTGNK